MPDLLAPGYRGPLVVALDANVLIDLQLHGPEMLSDDIQITEEKYAEELQCLGTLLHLWLVRDIRFVVTSRAFTDAKRGTPEFGQLVDGLAASLVFQYGDWMHPAPQNGPALQPVGDEQGLPDSADRDLILEAQAIGAHVSLTRDRKVVRGAMFAGPTMRACRPSNLAVEFIIARVEPMRGGTCGAPDYPYGDAMLPAPDMGKWGPLFAHFEDE